MLRKRFVAVCVLTGLCGLGCGGATPAPDDPSGLGGSPRGPITLMPSDTMAVVRIDARALRSSPYYGTVSGWLDQIMAASNEQSTQDERNFSMFRHALERTDVAWVGVVPGADPAGDPDLLLVAHGSYEPGMLESLLRSEDRSEIRVEDRNGRRVFVSSDASAVEADSRTWLLATGRRLSDMLARLEGQGGSTPLSSEVFTSMADRIGFERSAVSIVVEMTPALREELSRDMSDPTEVAVVQAMISFGAGLDIADGIALRAIAHNENAIVANAFVQEASRSIRELADNMLVQALGLGPALAQADVRVEGTDALLAVQVDDPSTRTALARASGLVALALAAAASMGEEATAVEDPGTDAGEPDEAP